MSDSYGFEQFSYLFFLYLPRVVAVSQGLQEAIFLREYSFFLLHQSHSYN